MKIKIQEELRGAQLQKDEVKISTLRLLLAEIKNAEIAKGGELLDQDIISVIQREAKKRREAALFFRSGLREEAALKEEVELKIVEGYLPAQMSDEELTKIVEEVINEIGAKNITDMGKVMGVIMDKVTGKADGGRVTALVKERLS